MGIAVKDGKEFRLLNGNETGVLLADYIFGNLTWRGEMLSDAYMVKTIVTTDLAISVAHKYGVNVKEVLTGFKYIGEAIDNYPDENYVFGMEESYGYLIGRHARDKDAVSAIMLIVEMAARYNAEGLSLIDKLNGLYSEFGFYASKLISKTFDGKSGMEFMSAFMKELRENPFTSVCGKKVDCIKDYLRGTDNLPKSNVLKFSGNDFSLVVRPSGTEPKIKVYLTAIGETEEKSYALLADLEKFTDSLFDR